MRQRESLWAPVLAAVVVLFWVTRLVAPGRNPGLASLDLRLLFYPTYEAFYGVLAQRGLVAWNPYQLCGIPWLGTLSGGFFYPPHVLYLALPTHLALAASSLLHLLFIALATMLFVREVAVGAASGLLAALVFTLRGFVPEWVRWPYYLEAGAWLPLGCLAVLAIARGQRRRGLALLATATGMSWLAACPQATVFLLYAWSGLLPALLLGARAGPRRWVTAAVTFAAGLGLGTLAGAAQLVPALEVAREGTRAARSLDVARMFPMGDPGLGVLRDAITGTVGSFGVIGLSLAPAAVLTRRHRALAFWAFAVGGLAFIFSLGPATPLFHAYLALPLLGWFRAPYRIRFLSDFGLAVLAALAADALFGMGPSSARQRTQQGLTVLCGSAIALYASSRRAYVAAFLAAGVVFLAMQRRRGALAIVVVIFAAVEVFLAPATGALLPYDAASAASYHRYADVYVQLAAMQGQGRVLVVHPPLSPPWFAPRLSTIYGVRSLDDYEPVTLRRQADYFTYLIEGRTRSASPAWTFMGGIPPPPTTGPWSLTPRRRLLDVAGVRLVLSPASSRPMLDFATGAGLVPLPAPAPGLALYENPRAVPRAYVVYHTDAAPPPEELLSRMSDPAFDPMRTSYVEGGVGLPTGGALLEGHPASIVRDEEELVEVDATLATPGILVLADAYFSRWQAFADGVPVPVLPTNHLFRGIALPAGHHRVRFQYRHASLRLGAGVSLAAALAIGIVFAWRGREGAKPAPYDVPGRWEV